ncbi:MAG: hypothetical protein AAF388_15035 [Bacteroidota bacterium]
MCLAYHLYPGAKSPVDASKTYSGEYLMKVGFNPGVSLWRKSVVLEIEAVE